MALVRHRPRGGGLLELVLTLPIMLPSVILGTALLIVFSPLALAQTMAGLVLAHTVIATPYMTRLLAATLTAIPADYDEIARIMGANPRDPLCT